MAIFRQYLSPAAFPLMSSSFSSPSPPPAYRLPVLLRLGMLLFLLASGAPRAHSQSLRKLERRAINRTHITFVNGDTVQRFTVTYARPAARPNRFYYWQGPTQILRTAGAYDGRLLSGTYQLTSRNGNLLGSGAFSKGLKTGSWRTWRPDGTPSSSSSWRRGQQRGKTRYYDATGQRLRVLSPPPAPAATTAAGSPSAPAVPRFWQPAYWRAVLTRQQLRRQQRQQAKVVAPAPAPPAKAVKIKKEKAKAPVPPGPAPAASPRSGP